MATQISVYNSFPVMSSSGRKLLRLANGWLVSAQPNTSSDALHDIMYSTNNGATWALFFRLSDAGGSNRISARISMASSGNIIHLIGSDVVNSATRWYKVDATTVTIGSNVTPTTSMASNTPYSLQIIIDPTNSNRIHTAFSNTDGSSTYYRYRYSSDGGATWGTVRDVSSSSQSPMGGSIALLLDNSNFPMYVYREGTGNNNLTMKRATAIDGSTWANASFPFSSKQATQINWSGNSNHHYLEMVRNSANGHMYIAYAAFDSALGNNSYYAQKSTDDGATWTAPVRITGSSTNSLWTSGTTYNAEISMTIDTSGRAWVLFNAQIRTAAGNYPSMYLYSTDTSGSMSSWTLQRSWIATSSIDWYINPRLLWNNTNVSAVEYTYSKNGTTFPNYYETGYIPKPSTAIQVTTPTEGSANHGSPPFNPTNIEILSNGWMVTAYENTYETGTASNHRMHLVVSKDSGATWQDVAIWTKPTSNWSFSTSFGTHGISSFGTKILFAYEARNSSSYGYYRPAYLLIDLATFTYGQEFGASHTSWGNSDAWDIQTVFFNSLGNAYSIERKYAGSDTYYNNIVAITTMNAVTAGSTVVSGYLQNPSTTMTSVANKPDGTTLISTAIGNGNTIGMNLFNPSNSTASSVAKTGLPTNANVCYIVRNPSDSAFYMILTENNGTYYQLKIYRSTDGTTWTNGTFLDGAGGGWARYAALSASWFAVQAGSNGKIYVHFLDTVNHGSSGNWNELCRYEITWTGSAFTNNATRQWTPTDRMLNGYESRPTRLYGTSASSYSSKLAVIFEDMWDTNYNSGRLWADVVSLNQPPDAPFLYLPANGGSYNSSTVHFEWGFSDPDTDNTQSAWQIQVARDSGFNDYIVINTTKVTGANGLLQAWDFYGLDDDVYYYRIMTWDQNDVASPWSWIPSFRIDTVMPTYNSSTALRGLNVPSGETFRVEVTGVADAGSGIYKVQFPTWTTANGQDDVQWYDGVNAGGGTWYFDVPIANHNNEEGEYITHPYAYDNAGNYIMTGVIQTYVDRTNPTAPTQTNGVLYATSNGVSWTAFSDGSLTSGLLLTTLYLQKWNGSSYVTEATYPKSVTGITNSITGLTPATQYRWGVTYTDLAGNVSTLNYTNFTTNSYAVTTINNLTSSGNLFNLRPKFRATVTDANNATLTNFQIQVSTVNTFASTILDTTSGASATGWSGTSASSGSTVSYTPQADLSVGTRYVRMRAYDGIEWGTWSATVTFSVNAVSWATTVSSGDTAISKRTIDDIRTKVNAVRQARGLAVATWTDSTINDWNNATPTPVRMGHLVELRQAIVDIFTALSITTPTWTDTVIDTTVSRKGTHWIELRDNLVKC